MNAGTRQTIIGLFAVIALFLLILISGRPISYVGSFEYSLIYGIGVCIPAICVASFAIYKSKNRGITDSRN